MMPRRGNGHERVEFLGYSSEGGFSWLPIRALGESVCKVEFGRFM